MPIRMKKDAGGGGRDNFPGRKSQQTGGGSSLIPLILTVLIRKPKLLLLVAAVAVVVFLLRPGGSVSDTEANQSGYGLGMEMNEQVYDQAEVFEPLADNKKNPMPESVSLLAYAPARLNQGRQGSCVGWASSYAARTILYSRETGMNPNRMPFSPSYVYNQIALENCQGSYMIRAMETLQRDGDVPLANFGYDESSCNIKPDGNLRSQASQFRIKGFNRLTKGAENYEVDMLAIKQNLVKGAPVVIGMQVGGTFMKGMMGRELWIPERADYTMRGYGGHAMCVIGYDDYHAGDEGAFQIMNSWGEEWGADGVAWVRYKDFEYFVKEAYGLYPMGSVNEPSPASLSVDIGFVNNASGQYISLKNEGGNMFSSVSPIRIGDPFKVEITNSKECYVYIFGQETDGTSYVLFPYTPKHSPYCGITGTRLFPRDYSLTPDDKGSRDQIAVVITATPIDYDELNRRITAASAVNYAAKLDAALGSMALENIDYSAGQTVSFSVDRISGNQAVGLVIAIDKR